MYTWRVIENNGGGLQLEVYEGKNLVFLHSGYEHEKTNLRDDIAALLEHNAPCNVNDWNGNEMSEVTPYPETMRADFGYGLTWREVACGGNKSFAVVKWGAAFMNAFFR